MEKKMKIIIVGFGKVGATLTEQLCAENHDVVVIDLQEKKLETAESNYDVMTVQGNGASFNVQMEAGVEEADLFIAVTASDELNLLCCLIAKKAGKCHTIARVRNSMYNKEIGFIKEQLGLSMIINPEMATAAEIARLLRFPSAIKIDPFAKGKVELLKFRLKPEFRLDGKSIVEINMKGKHNILVAGVERGEQVFIPNGDFVLQNSDLVSILASPKNASAFFKSIGLKTNQVRNCMIVGGGTIAIFLARMLLEMKMRVVIIEQSKERCELLADLLPDATVVNGDGTSKNLLFEENLENAEAFVALTNMDEENILLGMFAERMSHAKVVTKVNRVAFDDITDELELGSLIHPKYITTDRILQYTRATQNSIGSNVETLYHILDSKAEALEFVIRENSSVVGVELKDLRLKNNLLVGCINRGGKVLIPRGDDCLMVGDTVVVVTSQKCLRDIEDILEK